ncbi:hypothetical protein ACHWQZ_G003942 [Mnemiopsis leidyi]
MPGCIEHTQALMEELRDAKSKRRQVNAVWIDLMNAYARVPHELIVFALRHFKFPDEVVEYIVKYYNELIVPVKTRNWKSKWFYYMIGLFQGDPLSVVLFLIAFNLLLDLLQVDRSLGYKLSFSSDPTTNRVFADDLTLLLDRLDRMKRLIELLEEFLAWTRMMRAKPSKCIALGMKVVNNVYTSFDRDIIIANEKVAYLGETPIKFLGHWIHVNLNQDATRELITENLSGQFNKVDKAELTSPIKCWIYNHMLTSKVSKAHMLKTSTDPKIREVYKHRESTHKDKKRWDYTKELTERERDLYFKGLIGHIQTKEGAGVGFGAKKSKGTRESLVKVIHSLKEKELLLALYDKSVQGRFLTWENTMQLDTGWNLLFTWSQELTKFHLNAIHDVASTPNNLKLWNYSSSNNCPLCGRQHCNLKHILTCCPVSLRQGRYNWRHDQVPRVIVEPIVEKLREINSSTPKTQVEKKWGKYQSDKGVYKKPEVSLHEKPHFLEKANDWKLENFEDQKAPKLKRYEQLLIEIETAGWKGDLFTVEVGCRGFYHDTLPRIFNFLNIPRAKKKRALNKAAVVALKGSYTIWLSRYNKTWSDNWQLTERPGTF